MWGKTIREVLLRFVYDESVEPDKALIAYETAEELLLVPLTFFDADFSNNLLKFQGALIPLHKVRGIFKEGEGWLIFRGSSKPLANFSVELPNPPVLLCYVFDDFDLQRFFHILAESLESSQDLAAYFGTIKEVDSKLSIIEDCGSLSGSLIIKLQGRRIIVRGIPIEPPSLKLYEHKLNPFHRISVVEPCEDGIEISLRLKNFCLGKLCGAIPEGYAVYSCGEKILAVYSLERRSFLSLKEEVVFCQRRGLKLMRPVLERVRYTDYRWHLDALQGYIVKVQDRDLVFLTV